MGLSINLGDKFTAGNHISVTIITRTCESQGTPAATVKYVDGDAIEHTVKLIDDFKYKLRFFLPSEAKGEVSLALSLGSEKYEENVKIG